MSEDTYLSLFWTVIFVPLMLQGLVWFVPTGSRLVVSSALFFVHGLLIYRFVVVTDRDTALQHARGDAGLGDVVLFMASVGFTVLASAVTGFLAAKARKIVWAWAVPLILPLLYFAILTSRVLRW